MPESVSENIDLPQIGVLEELDEDDRRYLSGHGRVWKVEKGVEVIVEGDHQDCVCIVLKGKLEVKREGKDGPRSLAELNAGDAFGEMNFLDRERASASVTASSASKIWRMTRNDYFEFKDRHPEAATKLFHGLALMVVGRLRHTLREYAGQALAKDPKKRWWF